MHLRFTFNEIQFSNQKVYILYVFVCNIQNSLLFFLDCHHCLSEHLGHCPWHKAVLLLDYPVCSTYTAISFGN